MTVTYTCTRCAMDKPIEDYSIWNDRRDSRCRRCRADLATERRRANGVPEAPKSYIKDGLKSCLDCGIDKPLAEFSLCKAGLGGVQAYCKICSAAKLKAYYEANKESHLASTKQWQQENSEKANASKQNWVQNNPEKRKVSLAKHGSEKRVAELVLTQNAVNLIDGTVTTEFLSALYATPNCHYCGLFTELAKRTQDHKDPISKGGAHSADNLVMACLSCNSRKHTLTEAEFFLKLNAPVV